MTIALVACDFRKDIDQAHTQLVDPITQALDRSARSVGNGTTDILTELNLLRREAEQMRSTALRDIDEITRNASGALASNAHGMVDHVRSSVARDLHNLAITLGLPGTPLPVEPAFCSSSATHIEYSVRGLKTQSVTFYGYDLDEGGSVPASLTWELVSTSGSATPVQATVTIQKYQRTVDLNRMPFPLIRSSASLRARSRGKTLAELTIRDVTKTHVETRSVTPPPFGKFIPPLTVGDGDFAYNGPHVIVKVRTRIAGRDLWGQVYMKATEVDRFNPKPTPWGDRTTVEGWSKEFIMTTVAADEVILRCTPSSLEHSFIDQKGGDVDVFNQPLARLEVCGDGPGSNHAGTWTGVTVFFNSVKIDVQRSE